MTARQLVLLRHAKADSPVGVTDEQRPLSPRGRADAQAAGAWLAGQLIPELVLCSPAKRTRQTWHEVAAQLPSGAAPPVRYERELYLGDATAVLGLLQLLDDSVASALVIGHNPTLSQLAFALDPDGDLDSDGLRTCGLTVHEVAGSWRDCRAQAAPIRTTHTARLR